MLVSSTGGVLLLTFIDQIVSLQWGQFSGPFFLQKELYFLQVLSPLFNILHRLPCGHLFLLLFSIMRLSESAVRQA